MSNKNEMDIIERQVGVLNYIEETRKNLGKKVFKKEKQYKICIGRVSQSVDTLLEDRGEGIPLIVLKLDFRRLKQFPIGAPSVAARLGIDMSRYLQDIIVRDLVEGSDSSDKAFLTGGLDVVRGFQAVMIELKTVFDSLKDQGKLGIDVELIKKDPRGFHFADHVVKRLSNPEELMPYDDPKLIAGGAKLGANTYKKVYPIVEKVLKVLSSGR